MPPRADTDNLARFWTDLSLCSALVECACGWRHISMSRSGMWFEAGIHADTVHHGRMADGQKHPLKARARLKSNR